MHQSVAIMERKRNEVGRTSNEKQMRRHIHSACKIRQIIKPTSAVDAETEIMYKHATNKKISHVHDGAKSAKS